VHQARFSKTDRFGDFAGSRIALSQKAQIDKTCLLEEKEKR
jgi:hypothetical protein